MGSRKEHPACEKSSMLHLLDNQKLGKPKEENKQKSVTVTQPKPIVQSLDLEANSNCPSTKLSFLSLIEEHSLGDILLSIHEEFKVLDYKIEQMASNMADMHKQMNYFLDRATVAESRIDNLEEGSSKIADSIFALQTEITAVSDDMDCLTTMYAKLRQMARDVRKLNIDNVIESEDLETTSTSDMEDKLDSFRVPGNQKEREKDYTQQYTLSRYPSTKYLTSHSPLMQKVKNEEEELQYLEFVADVTNEILTLGLFSNRVLERVFERHVEQNRHRLDERKMHHLLNILRSDLGYKRESTENLNSSETHSFLLRKTSRSRLELDKEMLGKGIERYHYLRKKMLSSPQQLQIEEFLEKEIGQPTNGEHILNDFLTEELRPPKNLGMDQGTDPLSSDHDVELLSLDHDLNPKPLNKDLGHAPPEQDVNSKPLDQDVSLLSSHQEERPDALHTPEPKSNNSDSFCDLQRQSKEIENLERYFARSIMVSAENSESLLNLAEIPGADPSGAGDVQSERDDVFFQ